MGRKAKTKQGDPPSIHDNTDQPLKRKAEDEGSKRTPKKVKSTPIKGSIKSNGKRKDTSTKAVGTKNSSSKKTRKSKDNDSDSSLGWEGVDEGDLKAHAAYVLFILFRPLVTLHFSSLFDDPADDEMVVSGDEFENLKDDLSVFVFSGVAAF
jgi:hypothetical protein